MHNVDVETKFIALRVMQINLWFLSEVYRREQK